MTLVYMESFEAHIPAPISGLDVGGGAMQDAGYYWRGGTNQYYTYPAGYVTGQGMTLGNQNIAGAIQTNALTGRIGAWVRGPSSIPAQGFTIFRWKYTDTGGYRVFVQSDGRIEIRDWDGSLLDATGASQWNGDWRHLEFYCNSGTGRVELVIDSDLTLSADGSPSPQQKKISVDLGSRGQLYKPVYDHIYVTDGSSLVGDLHGVAVVAGTDLYGGDDRVQGSLIIDGSRYVTNPLYTLVDSQSSYGGGRNLNNVLNHLFPVNPHTGEDWSLANFTEVEQWGLCYVPVLEATEIRVTSMALATLEPYEKGPIVVTHPVSDVTSYSGNWRRSNPSFSLASHVRRLPRDPAVYEEGAMSLYVSSGCILFSAPTSLVNPEPPASSFGYIGLTFAEEFREDYRDWVRLDGSGQSFVSYFISGYSVLGDGDRKFQDNYTTVNYENVPTGKAYIQGLWDYAESPDTGRWSMRQVIENKGGDYTHGHRRFKIRGHGKALSIKITNNGDNPFVINGWTILASSNQST